MQALVPNFKSGLHVMFHKFHYIVDKRDHTRYTVYNDNNEQRYQRTLQYILGEGIVVKDMSKIGNPCEPSRPFLCQSYQRCIRLVDICDGKWDCEDGFDEDPAVCYSVSRPPEDALWEFLERQSRWMIPNLFNGADPQMVAHQLTVARSLSDLQERLGLTDKNVENIQRAFLGAIEGDERPLLRLGMPDGAWPEVKYLLEALYNSGLDV